MLIDDERTPEPVREDLRQIETAAKRGRQVVERMLEVGRRRQTSPMPSDLRDVVAEAIELLQASVLKSAEIRRHFDEASPKVLCDSTQVHQIVMNLGSNAARAMAASDGVLSVSLVPFAADAAAVSRNPALKEGLYARLTVRDNGAGMTAETLERAFEPFYTSSETGEGSGLGLWLVREIVQSLHGVIELSSHRGEGTTFDIFLPAAEPDAAAVSAREAHEVDVENAGSHVVYVEDEAMLANLGKRRLEMAGFRVTTYTSSVKALEDIRSRLPDMRLLVTDNTMPRLSGLDLAKEVTRLRPDMPVLMVSGLARMQLEEVPDYITRVLQKPYSMDDLVAAVRDLVYE